MLDAYADGQDRAGPADAAVDLARARRPGQHLLVPVGVPGAAGPRRPSGSRRTWQAGHDRARADPAGVLHRPAGPAAQRQPAHHRRLPRHLAAAARLRRRTHRDRTVQAATSPISTRPWSPRSWTTSNTTAATASATRNTRLAAIHSLFRYAALVHPEHADIIARVLAIPPKRFDRALSAYLTEPEIDALLAACDRTTWTGRRDHALLLLAVQTGLRISELTGLTRADVHLGVRRPRRLPRQGPQGQRATPLTTDTPSPCCATGSPSEPDDPPPRCSPAAADGP